MKKVFAFHMGKNENFFGYYLDPAPYFTKEKYKILLMGGEEDGIGCIILVMLMKLTLYIEQKIRLI